jgi:hypothetical protein
MEMFWRSHHRWVAYGLVALLLLAAGGVLSAGPARAEGEPPPAPEGFDATRCGERHQRLFSGDFDQFWSYAERHGWNGVGEFAWSVPQGADESDEAWRARAKQCFLEVERRNLAWTDAEGLYTVGYFLWHGGVVFGFERDPVRQPGVRERGYRKLLRARQLGFEKASVALIGVHYTMVRAIDTTVLRGARKNGVEPSPVPGWWPPAKRLLQDLNAMGAMGLASAFLSLSAIYRERWLMAEYFGVDHYGRKVSEPDPALLKASEVYAGWYETVRARQGAPAGMPSPRP